MKKLRFDYYMRIVYSIKATQCHYTIKCLPQSTDRQHIENIMVEIAHAKAWSEGRDSFGNQTIYGSLNQEHDDFSFRITGKAVTGLADYEVHTKDYELGKYKYPTALTMPGDGLRSYYEKLAADLKGADYERAVQMMYALYQDFTYEKNATNFATTAEEAWELGKGVCQDYSHILIVLCRLAGIPARYVSGMLIGEGYSHAWVEVLSEGRWYALDPTNNVLVADSHIKIGVGRDASDCMINKGIMIGGGSQTQEIRVSVECEDDSIKKQREEE